MKKVFFVLLLAITAGKLMAQEMGNTYLDDPIFRKQKVDFHYINIQKNISMDVEFHSIKQLPYLPNIDSIITLLKQDLQYLADSLKEDGVVRKLEYTLTPKIKKITITNHTEQPFSYTVQNKELKLFKDAKDTLVIKLGVFAGDSTSYYTMENHTKKQKSANLYPVYIKLYANNLKDITSLKNEVVALCLDNIKQNNKTIIANKAETGVGNLANPFAEKEILYYWNAQQKPKMQLVPTIGFGLQNLNSTWLPSFSYGLKYANNDFKNNYNLFSLTMDSYYNFSALGTSQEKRDVYSFLTFKYAYIHRKRENGFQLNPSLSLGYMVIKKGDFFQPHTFKFTIPSLQNGWLSIGPEIFFNNFFKNTSLGIKLAINYE